MAVSPVESSSAVPPPSGPRSVLVTGGSSGIGRTTVRLFAEAGWRVFSLSRRGEAPEGVTSLQADVTDADAVRAAFDRVLEATGGRLDALVNNAGSGIFGAAEDATADEIRTLFDVNLFAAMALANRALGVMRRQGGGALVNVASAAAIFPLPFQSYYTASKAALLAWTRAVAGEVAPFGIRMTAVCPGDVQTGFTDARRRPAVDAGVYGPAVARALEKAERAERGGQSPEVVAREIVRFAGMEHPPLVAIPGAGYAALDRLARLLPRTWVSRLIAKVYT